MFKQRLQNKLVDTEKMVLVLALKDVPDAKIFSLIGGIRQYYKIVKGGEYLIPETLWNRIKQDYTGKLRRVGGDMRYKKKYTKGSDEIEN